MGALGGAARGWLSWPLAMDYGCFIAFFSILELSRSIGLAQLSLAVREQGCTQLLPFLVILQLVESAFQAVLQAVLEAVTANSAGNRTLVCSAFLAILAIILLIAIAVMRYTRTSQGVGGEGLENLMQEHSNHNDPNF